jgi:hypothetical protein
MNAYALASASGLTFAFYFFLTISTAIGWMIYALLTMSTARRVQLAIPTVSKRLAAFLAVVVTIALFSTIYMSSLAGFHTVVAGTDRLQLDYAVPNRSIGLRYDELGDVIRRPAFKSRWRLEIYTRTGNKFQSAPGSYQYVKAAAEEIERRRK